jgi:twitching motility protein PilU
LNQIEKQDRLQKPFYFKELIMIGEQDLNQIRDYVVKILPQLLNQDPEISTTIEGLIAQHSRREESQLVNEVRLLREDMQHIFAMIDYRNANSPGHILTIEDPVEFSHPNKMSIINQREVGVDTASYAAAIKASLREAPDVILIGEIRTMETMEAGLELANTGHLCVSTMHANNANQALDRIVNMFPTSKQKSLFMDMSGNIRAIISQRLIPDVRGKRCAAIEVMINTPNIANLILKGKLTEIKDAMKASGAKGMCTFDDALYYLYKDNKISKEEALKNADSRNDLEGKISFG